MASSPYVDSHTHAQFAAYDADRDTAIRRALDAGVWMINVGTQKDTSRAAVELAEKHEGLFAAVGLHPIHTERSYHDPKELGADPSGTGFTSRGEAFDAEYYHALGTHEKVVAIGECGLDYFRLEKKTSKQAQKDVFEKQIDLAAKLKKPLMIHCRPTPASQDAYEDLYEILAPRMSEIPGAANHFFAGDLEIAKKFLGLGMYLTFGGVVTFARNYDDVIQYVPRDRLLLETDAPYLTPAPHRGKRNEPLYVIETYKKMAELKKIPLAQLQVQVFENNKRLFGF